jgi:glutamate/tyrosine decarboxylase-like PLP-dependent enzyme
MSSPEPDGNVSPDRAALERAFGHALAHLERLDSDPVAAPASLDELRRALGRSLPERGLAAAQVVDELVADTARGLNGSQGGRFFGWVIGGGLPAAMAADWLATVWDQNAGVYPCAPAASVVEEIAGAWLKALFELPAEASFAFVTGTQMAHVTCLAAARHAVLAARGWDVARQGLFGAPPIRILANADRHGSVDRAIRLLGFGSDALEELPVDAAGKVAPETLSRALAGADGPAIVVLQAGELNLATFDPFETLAPIARAAGAWVHVDGAFGLWAKVSPAHRHLAAGLELCDSWTVDGHKVLNVPYDCGFAVVRDSVAHRAAMALETSYLPDVEGARDQIDWGPDFSRRARGFAVYAALRQLGREGVAELVARLCRHANALASRIGALPGAELIAASGLNQGLVRFLAETPGATDADHDQRTDAVIAAINASGEALVGGVTWRGRRAMRLSVCNWRTTDADVDRTIAAAQRAIAACRD